MEKSYKAEDIQVLSRLNSVRKNFDLVKLAHKIKKRGDLLILSKELKIKPRILALAKDEGRILANFPNLEKSKACILARLRTDRELRLFAKKYDIYKISARGLLQLVIIWNKDIQKNPLLFIEKKEHDLIIGSLLGDASIRQREQNSCLRISHSIKQGTYINWKHNVLKNFVFSEFYKRKRILNNQEVEMVILATKTHPVFNYYRNLFYKNNRKVINKNVLEHINTRSLAIWICDDGSFDRTYGYIILCTNSYNLDEHRLLKEFFNRKFGLNPTIGLRDKKYFYLRFKKDDSKKLIEFIKPFIPKGMEYKIRIQ